MKTQDESLFERQSHRSSDDPVQCLGLAFANDEERRSYFLALLREKLKDPEFRSIPGFPVGEDESILALSDPPFYTACPNPWLADFVASGSVPESQDSDEHACEPFAADVSEGKNDPYYATFNYHTKVPPEAIRRYIAHYVPSGGVVADVFCGSGMTGLACALQSLASEKSELRPGTQPEVTCLLIDLSPVATYLSDAFTRSVDGPSLLREGKAIYEEGKSALSWLYECADGVLDYAVWTDVFVCPVCATEVDYYSCTIDSGSLVELQEPKCCHCGASFNVRTAKRAMRTVLDPLVGEPVSTAKEALVVQYVSSNHGRVAVPAGQADGSVNERAREEVAEYSIPVSELPDGFNTRQPRESHGFRYVHQFYTWRNLLVLGWLTRRIDTSPADLRPLLRVILLSLHARASRRNRHIPKYGHRHVGVLSGTLYIPSIREETNQFEAFMRRVRKAASSIGHRQLPRVCAISTQSATSLSLIGESSIDYVFVDPPFGANIMYSELNYLWEAWLGVVTSQSTEAIENPVQGKSTTDYQRLMAQSFGEIRRVLKPGRWLTVEFHNSKNAVWNAIQEALQQAGMVVADVRTLDKKKGTIKQLSTAAAVRQDLVISAYKPRGDTERAFTLKAGLPEGAWAFVSGHLRQLPIAVESADTLEVVVERQAYLLYDRMVAFHVLRGLQVPLSAAEFYAGLEERFACRDRMYFLQEQVSEYDKKRMQAQEIRQLELFVTDEESAIQWLRQTLSDRPMSFQDIHPLFMREIAGWERHEKALELAELLEENFIVYDGNGEVPSQIHAYLSSNFREMRALDKTNPTLRAKAKDRWFVPDARKAGDLEQLRERTLLNEFDECASEKGKLKLFRLEAVRVGFKRAWQEHDYQTIIAVSERLPADVLREDAKLLMWYDQALTRAGE